jgi:hypothetical protein
MPQSAKPFVSWTITDLWPWLQPPGGTFSQPILPGWTPTLNINSNNSTAPQTEVAIVEKHSYGRQLGRISDALRVLLLEQHPKSPEDGPIGQFYTMWEEIEQVKIESAVARLDQIGSDLALLKEKNPSEYSRLRNVLSRALKQTG